jgi:phage baseplate assembly protein W
MAAKQAIEEYAVSLPFTVGIDGVVASTNNQSKIWQDRVLSAVGTAFGERVLNYTYGSGIYTQVFDTQEGAVDIVKREVNAVFHTFFPLLTLQAVNTNFDSTTGTLSIEIVYLLPNLEISSVYTGAVVLNGQYPNSKDN